MLDDQAPRAVCEGRCAVTVQEGIAIPPEVPETAAWIELDHVGRSFGDLRVLDGIDLKLPMHSRLGLVGPSGCGKTTLLEIIAGLQEPDRGWCRVAVDARAAAQRLRQCALMPQKDLLLPWRSALDNACLPLENQGISRAQARRRVEPYFKHFGLESFETARPRELSGGMRQRVAFIRTLVTDKEVLLLDEPFGALDSITRADMQQWLNRALSDAPRTVLLVTHDVEEALYLSERVVVLSKRPGRLVRELEVELPSDLPRRDLVTSARFGELKEQALEALEC